MTGVRIKIFIAYAILLNLAVPDILRAHEKANKIVIDGSGIFAVSDHISDKIKVDARTGMVLCCYPDSIQSFWYKIYVVVDSRITFEIRPSDPSDRYNYFLYRQEGDLDVEDVYNSSLAPVRANLYTGRTKAGTGLSLSSKVSITDSCPENVSEIFYGTPYHSSVAARSGDVLLLNVYHLRGKDCGHIFILKSGSSSVRFQSIYEKCYKPEEVVLEEGLAFKAGPLFARRPTGPVKGFLLVKDSVSHIPVQAQITWTKELNSMISVSHELNNSWTGMLEPGTVYTFTFTAFGYRDKIVTFSAADDPAAFAQTVELAPVRPGDHFRLNEIYFYPNTYALKPGATDQLNQLAAFLRRNPEARIEIQGHTNGNKRIRKHYKNEEEIVPVMQDRFRGSAKKLSQCRAELIKQQLVKRGVAPERLEAKGYGGALMIFPHPDTQAKADLNIRVEVLVLPNEVFATKK